MNTGTSTWSELLQLTEVKKPTLYQHLEDLKRQGWIRKDDEGKYMITGEGEAALKIKSREERAAEESRKLIADLESIKVKDFESSTNEGNLQFKMVFHFKDKSSLEKAAKLLKKWPAGIFVLPLLMGDEAELKSTSQSRHTNR